MVGINPMTALLMLARAAGLALTGASGQRPPPPRPPTTLNLTNSTESNMQGYK
jgi:hypothetical protein